MEGWPGYWPGLPPMYYATHCVGPILGLMGEPGGIRFLFRLRHDREDMHACYGSPFAVETCHIKFKDSDVSAQVYRSLFDVARQYRESIEVYGTKKSVEWPLIEHDPLVIHTAKKPEPEIPEEVECPDFAHFCRRRSSPSPRAESMAEKAGRSTFRSPRAPATAASIPTSSTSSSKCSRPARCLSERRPERQHHLHRHPRPRIREARRCHHSPPRLHTRMISIRSRARLDNAFPSTCF